jgi:hypothetical protein
MHGRDHLTCIFADYRYGCERLELMKIRSMPFVFALLCLCTASAVADTYTWTGKAPAGHSQDWFNVQNWSPSNNVPGAGDTAIIVPVNGSGFIVNVDSSVTVDNLTVITSVLQGGGSLTVNTAMECQNAALSPGGGITMGGTLTVDPVPNIPAFRTTTLSCPLTMNGLTMINSNGILQFGAAVSLINNGTFILEAGSQLSLSSGSGSSFINKSSFFCLGGLATVTSGSSVFSNAPSGNVTAGSGATLQLQGTVAESGTFQPSVNGIIIDTANTAFHGGATLGGQGLTLLAGGSHTLDGTVTVSGSLQMGTNGIPVITLNGTLEVVQNGNFALLGGGLVGVGTNLTGTILIDTNGVMQINNLNGLTLKNVVVTNNGSINWLDSGVLFMGYNAQINNGGIFNVFGDGSLVPLANGSPGYGVATFNNGDGTFQKQQGSTNSNVGTKLGIPFYDGGVIVEQGTVMFAAGGSIDTWQVASNGAVQLKGGTFSLKSENGFGGGGKIEGLVGDGAGAVTMNSGVTLTFPLLAALIVNGGKFIQSGGTINGGDGLYVGAGGLFVWNGGTINSLFVSISSDSAMNISSGSTKSIYDSLLDNKGTVNWTNANSVGFVSAGDDVVFDNPGLFNILCDSYCNDVSTNINTRPVMTNEVTGVITKAGTSGTTTLGIKLVNLGRIVPVQGNLEVGQFEDAANELAGLELDMEGGKITFDNASVIHGDVDGSGTIVANHGLTFSDDEVDIYLIIFFGDITNDGTFILFFGVPGDITFQNNFIQTANGKVVIPIRGTNAVTKDFGQLIVSGLNQAFLGGTLETHVINGFAPPVGATFPFLTSFQRNGTFSKVIVPQGMQLNYTAGGATLVVTGAVPVQILSPAVTNGQFQFGFNTISNRSYTVQYKDDLTATNWTTLTNFTGTGSYWQVPPLSPLVAHRFFRVSNP